MKEKEEDALMKSRSARSIVVSAYRLYTGNFKRIFRSSWLLATIYALFDSAVGTICVVALPPVAIALMADPLAVARLGMTYLTLLAVVGVLVVGGGLAELMFYSSAISMMRGHAERGIINDIGRKFPINDWWRCIKASLSILLVNLPVIIAFAAFYHYKLKEGLAAGNGMTLLGVTAIALLVVFILELPLTYAAMRYVMQAKAKFWTSLPKSYTAGLSHLGTIFVVMLTNAIILVAAHFVITLPALILQVSNITANIGTVMGDPLGMPSYMTVLCVATFLISGFIQAYIRMTLIFSLYYQYGAIETAENEKQQFNNDTKQ